MTGTTLSHYKIVSELGRGGMGIVYLAEDTKLDRQVAIKVLPPSALASEDDRARFYREAKAAAALNHPNIAGIYQIDEAVPSDAPHGTEPSPFIAMEYIDGEPLDDRIKRGPLKLAEALRLATQITGALGEAHEKGIVHRDVKASNVMLTSKGDAKVLDFGLALTAASTKLTRMGSTLGTVAYMSPEQARGEEVDNRTDLWAVGVVLYEMVAGRNPFGGDYEQAVVYSILNAEPEPLTAVRTGVPMELERIVRKALSKDARLRYQTAAGLISDLRTIDLTTSVKHPTGNISGVRPRANSDVASGSKAGIPLRFLGIPAALLLLVAAYWLGRNHDGNAGTSDSAIIRAEIPLPDIQSLISLDVANDGRHLAFTGATKDGRMAGILDLTTGRINRIEGAEGTTEVTVSADDQWVYLTNPTAVTRVSINGGRAQEFIRTDEAFPQAGAGTESLTLFEDNRSIWVFDEPAQSKRLVVGVDSIEGVVDLDWPRLLQDGKTLLATIEYADSRVAIGFWDLNTGTLLGTYEPGGYRARILPTGHLLFYQSGDLLAVPFDVDRLQATAAPIPLMRLQSRSLFTVSESGTLIVGRASESSLPPADETFFHELVLYDLRSKDATPLPVQEGLFASVDSDPTGFRLAVTRYDGTGRSDVWIELIRDGGQFQVTTDGRSGAAQWFSEGDSILYVRRGPQGRSDREDVMIITSPTGAASDRIILGDEVGSRIQGADISEDGSLVVYSQTISGSVDQGSGLVRIDRRTGESTSLLIDARPITDVEISPDGRFVAIDIDGQVYVIPSEPGGGPTSISDGPGSGPRWSPDQRWIYFMRDQDLVRVPVRIEPVFSRGGSAEVLFRTNAAPALTWNVLGSRAAVVVVDVPLGGQATSDDEMSDHPRLDLLINLPGEIERVQEGRN